MDNTIGRVKRKPTIRTNAIDTWSSDKLYKDGFYDVGVCMTTLGYDAINAKGHGESGSYTVVLNRTKVILDKNSVEVD